MDVINCGRGAVELPAELVHQVLSLAAELGSWSERRTILSLSKDIYGIVARVVYRLVQVASPVSPGCFAYPERFGNFITWMDSKTPAFLNSTVKGLNIILSTSRGHDADVWRRIFANMQGLQMLYIFCSSWEGDASLLSAWNGILALPDLKSLRLDWHFDQFTIPSSRTPMFCALQSVTRLSIVGNRKRSFDLKDIRQFDRLSHLAVINPDLGYTKHDLNQFYDRLGGLEILVVTVFGLVSANAFRHHFNGMKKFVVLEHTGTEYEEFKNQMNGGETIWTRAEDIVRKRD
ncbi:hypothetical protein DL96DRAFT_1590074, partial [Flagelloscypha sp. PMI_526]